MTNRLTNSVRSLMIYPARFVNYLSRGHIKPDHITAISLLGHLAVFWALAWNAPVSSPRLAALFLIVFGLMDSLDGALARLQHRSSLSGMFNDAVSDRLKEVIVYFSVAMFVFNHPDYYQSDSLLAVLALGFSALVSYAKAKGEMAVASLGKTNAQTLNRLFGDGIARYEVRMALIVVGLLFPVMPQVLHTVIALTFLTAMWRFARITRYLKTQDVQN